jgi:hypothetical protein
VAGRFLLYTDADIQGAVVKALEDSDWNVLRAIDAFPERTPDLTHFERAAALGRVLVTNDGDQKRIAFEWYAVGRPLPGVIWWPQTQYRLMRPGDFVKRFEGYAQQPNPFADFPVLHLKPYA